MPLCPKKAHKQAKSLNPQRTVVRRLSWYTACIVLNVRPNDQIQLAVPKLESQGVCPRTRSMSRATLGRVGDKNLPFGDTPLSGGVLLVLPARPHKLWAALLPILPPSFPAPERVDHDVVDAVCVLFYSVLVVQCLHAGSCLTLRQIRPTFYRFH